MSKFLCSECGTRHKPGQCPMESAKPKRRRGKVRVPKDDNPICFPHKYIWGQWLLFNSGNHVRYQFCSKCNQQRMGVREISKHRFFAGVCIGCGIPKKMY